MTALQTAIDYMEEHLVKDVKNYVESTAMIQHGLELPNYRAMSVAIAQRVTETMTVLNVTRMAVDKSVQTILVKDFLNKQKTLSANFLDAPENQDMVSQLSELEDVLLRAKVADQQAKFNKLLVAFEEE